MAKPKMGEDDLAVMLVGCRGRWIEKLEDFPEGTRVVPFILSDVFKRGCNGEVAMKAALADAGYVLIKELRKISKDGDKPRKTVSKRITQK